MTTRPDERPAPRILTREEARRLIAALEASMDDVLAILSYETALVKAGKLAKAAELAASKEEKSARYTSLMMQVRDEVEILAALEPAATNAMRSKHELFRAEVQINLAVLATAREVAEDLMRSVAAEVGRSRNAPVYGQTGTHVPASSAGAKGIAINRNL